MASTKKKKAEGASPRGAQLTRDFVRSLVVVRKEVFTRPDGTKIDYGYIDLCGIEAGAFASHRSAEINGEELRITLWMRIDAEQRRNLE